MTAPSEPSPDLAPASPGPPDPGPRRLSRSPNGVVAGVATGIADYMEIDPVLTRLGFVLGLVFSGGTAFLLYLALWVVMPKAEAPATAGAPQATGGDDRDRTAHNSARLIGWLLVAFGALLLLNRLALVEWIGLDIFSYSWPVMLIVGGLLVVMLGRDRAGD